MQACTCSHVYAGVCMLACACRRVHAAVCMQACATAFLQIHVFAVGTLCLTACVTPTYAECGCVTRRQKNSQTRDFEKGEEIWIQQNMSWHLRRTPCTLLLHQCPHHHQALWGLSLSSSSQFFFFFSLLAPLCFSSMSSSFRVPSPLLWQ